MSVSLTSAAAILKNIFEFVKILNSASHQSVALWDDLSLTNALDWADYCQELYREIKGQDYEQDVNSQMRQMVAFLDPVSCLLLSVDSLGSARTLLVEALISNASLPSSSQERLANILGRRPEGLKILKEVQQRCSESTRHLQLCTDVLTSLTDKRGDNCLQSLSSHHQANVLMDSLVTAVKHIQKEERFDKYCHNVYNQLAQTQEGWIVLVNLFTRKHFPVDMAQYQDKILKVFLSRMKEGIQVDVSTSLFWTVPVDILTEASCVSEQFFLSYLDALLALGDSYLPHIQHNGFVLWRSKQHLTQKELCNHFQRLLESSTSSTERKSRILGAITDSVRGSEFTVWQSLVQNLLQIFKQG